MRLSETLAVLADLGDPDLLEPLASWTVFGRRAPDAVFAVRGTLIFTWTSVRV